VSWLALVRRHARVHLGTLITLGVLVLVTSFLAAAAPRAVTAGYDSALTDLLTEAPDLRRDINLAGTLPHTTAADAGLASAAEIQAMGDDLRSQLPITLRRMLAGTTSTGRSQTFSILDRLVGEPRGSQLINIRYDSDVADRIRYIQGKPPGPGSTTEVFQGGGRSVTRPRIDVAVSRQTAEQMHFDVGHQLLVHTKPSFSPVEELDFVIRISGIFEPINPADQVWSHTPSLLEAQLRPVSVAGQEIEATGVLSAESWAGFAKMAGTTPRFEWRHRFDFSTITVAQAPEVLNSVRFFTTYLPDLDESLPALQLSASTGLDGLIADFQGEQRTANSVLSLSTYAVLAVAIAVLALAAQLAADQRRSALALIRARGGSLVQAVALVMLEVAAVAVPAALVGYLAAIATIDTRSPVSGSGRLVTAVLVSAVVLPGIFVAWTHRKVGRDERRDLVTVQPSPRRVAAEALVIALAIAGAYTLRERGLTTGAAELGADPFLVSVPVLIALGAGLLALRLYPYPLRALGQVTAARRSAVPFLGVARASREGTTAAVPLLALLMTLALGVFGSVLNTSVARSQERQTWRDIGADAQLEGFGFDEGAVARVGTAPGVDSVINAYTNDRANLRVEGTTAVPITFVAIEPEQYSRLAHRIGLDVPMPPVAPQDGRAGALLSSNLATNYSGRGALSVQWSTTNVDIDPVGTIDFFPGIPPGRDLVVIPYQPVADTGAVQPNLLFVDGPGVTTETLRAAVSQDLVAISSRVDRLAEIRQDPITKLTLGAFRLALLVMAVYSVLAILLGLVLGADRRGLLVSYLRTLGLNRQQSYGLLLLEIGPLVGIAVVAGLTVGLVIAAVVMPGIDLRPFTGADDPPALSIDPRVMIALAGALILLVGIAMLVDAALNRRRRLGSVLRVGEQ
jgi:putative ABC transport system permease protein